VKKGGGVGEELKKRGISITPIKSSVPRIMWEGEKGNRERGGEKKKRKDVEK